MIIINVINGDQSTQTDFERENGVQVNLKNYKEEYERKFATGDWHLEGGEVTNFTRWMERQNRTMQIQTMDLEANKRYYKANKFDKWFDKENDTTDSQARAATQEVTEVETEQENQFDPALATLDLIGTIGNVIADPVGTFITVNPSPAVSASSKEEAEAKKLP